MYDKLNGIFAIAIVCEVQLDCSVLERDEEAMAEVAEVIMT